MNWRSILARPFAAYLVKKQNKWANNPISTQTETLNHLIKESKYTTFGKDHQFEKNKKL